MSKMIQRTYESCRGKSPWAATGLLYYYSNLANTLTPDTTIGGYTLENARMEWNDIAGSRVHLAGFVRNLTNKQSYVGGFSLGALIGIKLGYTGFAAHVRARSRRQILIWGPLM
jgi:hypothetical protein